MQANGKREQILWKCLSLRSLWAESRVQGDLGEFPLIQSHDKIEEVDIGGITIYHPFGEFRRANSYSHLYGAYGTEAYRFCPSDKGATSMVSLAEFRKGDLLICRGAIYP
ncbi:hypothetical protein TNCV_211321 [Trichonephila clavipes]|uniref:Uncharacterized protein n=1 Tax=Trichonephila clavipes TaxID=2585209 RepID=A0A8X6SYT2_TRICX|nr:hypothetical protein TNCV_211321 [Trichonephila clavipes]